MNTLLLVDDDVELAAMLKEYFEREGYRVELAHDGAAGAERALAGDVDLVVLDSMMPRCNGLDALRRIRAHGALPVLMLTARGDDVDCVAALELGADDYVAKPCSARTLLARVRALLRRASLGAGAEPVLVSHQLRLWPALRRAEWAGEPLTLTGAEFNILAMLLRQAGQTVSKETLSETALGRPLEPYDRSVDTHVSHIRQKLSAVAGERPLIRTVYRGGYHWLAE